MSTKSRTLTMWRIVKLFDQVASPPAALYSTEQQALNEADKLDEAEKAFRARIEQLGITSYPVQRGTHFYGTTETLVTIHLGDADPRVFEAAPDLLEACQFALSLLNGISPVVDEMLTAAIAKATGGDQ